MRGVGDHGWPTFFPPREFVVSGMRQGLIFDTLRAFRLL
jgi:hypothetical protein